MKRVADEQGLPLIFLGESTGARMPDTMGARGMGSLLGNDPHQYARTRTTPWISAVLGDCYGSSTWYTCLSDFVVMRKGSVLAVSSPLLVSHATGENVDPEELGGWRLHAERTGLVDLVVESDMEALDAIRKALQYFPSHREESPPRASVVETATDQLAALEDVVPADRAKVYDVER